MGLKTALKAHFLEWETSQKQQQLRHGRIELGRKFLLRSHKLLYFHRVDDPYCQLMVQVLPELEERFNVQVKPIVVEQLPATMYPEPQRYEAYTILDTVRQAKLYGLGFPARAIVPDVLSVRMANSFLAEQQDNPDFFSLAEDVGAALWQRNLVRMQEICGNARIEHSHILRTNERLLMRLGHYASATIFYGKEFYHGLSRLEHLEARLNRLGIGDGERHFDMGRMWMDDIVHRPFDASGQIVELFHSLRSPYSYLALEQLMYLKQHTGVNIFVRPVLPLVDRGMPVPVMKLRYFIQDAAREAHMNKIQFGRIIDPLPAVRNALIIGSWARSAGKDLNFYRAFAQAHFSRAIDGSTKRGLARICASVNISARLALRVGQKDNWQGTVKKNGQEMLRLGCWGVPTLRCGNIVTWGQDRIYAIVEALKKGAGRIR